MTDFVAQLDIDDVGRGHADDLATLFYKLWRETDAKIGGEDTPLVKLMPHLVMLDVCHDHNDSPDILFVGNQSFLAKLIPTATETSDDNPKKAIDPEFRLLVRNSYEAASAGEPCYDVIRSNYELPEGTTRLTYERLLLPFVTRTGKRWIFCYSIPKEVKTEAAGRGLEYRIPTTALRTSRGQLLQERLSTEFRHAPVQIHT
jgi:hypothetical protein